VVTFYATGWQSSPDFADGQVATYAQNDCLGACIATVQNVPNSRVVYGGPAPGIVAGVTQFNIELGSTVATGGAAASVTDFSGILNLTVNLTIWVAP
jgi:hypothetical protein